MRNLFTPFKSWIVQRLASSQIAGSEVTDAIRVCKLAAQRGWSSTVGLWSFATDPPEVVASGYAEALSSIIREDLDSRLSIKVPSLHYDFELLRDLLQLSRESGVRIHFDSLDPESAAPSFALLERAVSIYWNLGYTLPSRWRRSLSDAERAVDLGISIRVVKGQWSDLVSPKLDPRTGFLNLVDMLAGRAREVSIATHDAVVAKQSLIRLQSSQTPCELEQLFGLPLLYERIAKPLCVKMRLYVPYGSAYLTYAVKQAIRRPAIAGWVLRDLFSGRHGRIWRIH
jgi:proline dehydrogenase